MNDWHLLCEFVSRDSQSAFQDLVNRHLNLVHSVALRQVQDSQLAEEVTQAVFILLARKAARLKEDTILAGWLYRTTRFVASRALRAEHRRKRREQEAFQMQQTDSSDPTWNKLEPILDDGIERLGKAERDAILLRFFEEQSFSKVGDVLGISEEAARKRVDRSLEKLRQFFTRRGFAITAGVLATVMAKHCAQASPAALAGSVGPAALALSGAAASSLPLLARETISAWRWATVKTAITWSAVTAAALLVLINVPRSDHRPLAGTAATETGTIKAESPIAATTGGGGTSASKPASRQHSGNTFEFQVLDGLTGKPLEGALIMAVTAEDVQHVHYDSNLTTDASGNCFLPLNSQNLKMLVIGAAAEGYEERCAFFGGPEAIPASYTLKLAHGSKIGGVVVDASGKPVVDAEIKVQFYETGDSSAREFQRERPGFPEGSPAVQTDAAGRWSFGSAPETKGGFSIEVKHPSFPKASFHTEDDQYFMTGPDSLKLDALHSGNALLTLKSGPSLGGVVLDSAGKPVSGARVRIGEFALSDNPTAETGADGAFELRNLAAGPGHVTVTADGFAPERQAVSVADNSSPLKIQLQPGALLRLQVVDINGNPLRHVDVRLQDWRGNNSLDWGGLTDDQGRIEWSSAPVDQMDIFAGKEGFFYSRKNMITADGQEHKIVLRKELTVTGYVTDSKTKQPISSFKAIPGTERLELVHGTNGMYELTFHEEKPPLQIRFEADGYLPTVSEPLDPNALGLTYAAELTKENPEDAVSGTVLLPDGSPAASTQVALCTGEQTVTLGKGKFLNPENSILAITSANGRFSFPPMADAGTVVAINALGFGTAEAHSTNRAEIVVHIQPWGRIEGTLKHRAVAGRKMTVLNPGGNRSGTFNFDFNAFSTETDDAGNFVFVQVPAGDMDVYLVPGIGQVFSDQTPVHVEAGATVKLQVGGTGATVTGRLVLSDASSQVDWTKQVRFAHIQTKIAPPQVPAGLTGNERREWLAAYWKSPEGLARNRELHSYTLEIEPDGSFTVEDVPPGTYELIAQLRNSKSDPGDPMGGKPIGSVRQEVVVPEGRGDASAQTFEMGSVAVKLNSK